MKTQSQLLTTAAMIAIVAIVCLNHVAGSQQKILHLNKMIFAHSAKGEANDGGPVSFSPKDHEIYCILGVENPDAAAKYKFNWSRYDEAENQKLIFQEEVTNQTTNEVVSRFSSPSDLPPGHYKVDLWVSGHHKQSRFDVTNE
jgi:hypothetical protein